MLKKKYVNKKEQVNTWFACVIVDFSPDANLKDKGRNIIFINNVAWLKYHAYSSNLDYISSLRDFVQSGVTIYFYQYLIPYGIVPEGQNIGSITV